MLETFGFGIGAVLALLLLDLGVRRLARRPDEQSPGRRILQAARVFGMFLLAGTLATACHAGVDTVADIAWMGMFGLTGLLAFELALGLGQRTLGNLPEAARRDNFAAATALAAHTIAIGVLVANVFGGRSFPELWLACASFAIGQLTLLVLVWLFRRLTSYDDHAEMQDGNMAAALSHGGLTIALALVIANATDGPYQGVVPSLQAYAVALGEGLLVYPVRQIVVQCLLLRQKPSLFGGELDRAIAERRDLGTGALEAATYIAAALFVRSLA